MGRSHVRHKQGLKRGKKKPITLHDQKEVEGKDPPSILQKKKKEALVDARDRDGEEKKERR